MTYKVQTTWFNHMIKMNDSLYGSRFNLAFVKNND